MTKGQRFRKALGDPFNHVVSNRKAAELILEKAAPGDDSIAVQWARRVLHTHGAQDDHQQDSQAALDLGDRRG